MATMKAQGAIARHQMAERIGGDERDAGRRWSAGPSCSRHQGPAVGAMVVAVQAFDLASRHGRSADPHGHGLHDRGRVVMAA